MELIQNNPYRIAGILAGASERELQRQKAKISRYTSIGKEISSEYDFSFLDTANRDEGNINKAFSGLEQNQGKVRNALFWFLNVNPFDNTAIEYLKTGDTEKAIEIWEKVTHGKEVNSKNFSCFNNLGTFKLLGNSKTEIKEGINAKIKLIESDRFSDFIHSVADETYTMDSQKQAEILVDDLLVQFKEKFTTPETFDLFGNCNGTIQKYLSRKFTEQPIHKIESQVKDTKSKRKANKKEAYDYGYRLYVNCKDDLATLKKLLGAADLKYKMIADNLSKEIMQCGIDYFKEIEKNGEFSNINEEHRKYMGLSQDSDEFWEKAIKLLKYSQSIAVGTQTKDRAKENIEGIKEWAKTARIKEELDFIANKLSRFQDLNDTPRNAKDLIVSCNPKLQSIRNKVGPTDDFYLKISSAVANNAQGMIISAVNDEQEIFSFCVNPENADTEKIGRIIAKRSDGTEFSFNQQIHAMITDRHTAIQNLKSVIRSSLEVSNLIGTLDMVPDLRSKYNKNQSTLKSIASQLGISRSTSTSSNSSSSSSSSGSCYIATMAYGDYNHPQVMKLRKFRDEVLCEHYLGRILITFYYKYSPNLVQKLKGNEKVNEFIRKVLDQFINVINK